MECLVTKLNASVNKDNLVYFDTIEIVLDFENNPTKFFVLYSKSNSTLLFGGVGVEYIPIENCHFTDQSGNVIETDGKYIMPSTPATDVRVTPINTGAVSKFHLKGMSSITTIFKNQNSYLRIPQDYLNKLKYLSLSGDDNNNNIRPNISAPDVDGVNYTDFNYIKDLQINKETIISFTFDPLSDTSQRTVDIASFGKYTAVTTLMLNSSGAYGDIADLGTLTRLNNFAFYNTKIKGTVESLVAGLIASGKSTGSISDVNFNGIVTFNNSPVSAGHKTVSWTGVNNITISNI